ncbi:putative 7-carboxy-7-deazaguanine synthase QueE [Clostridium sediminicola]|uniref:putative 7-carboxy-7-deazaguanine synthase QueE n=1 Tax=Clostridium sediminicola TaxID=3114879 RepID=UPI0031F24E47
MQYKVVEKFVSINGEGIKAGELSIFIRFAGCNLDCSYCDTKWANEKNVQYELLEKEEILSYIKECGIKNVTLTGGEPLIQEGIGQLISFLMKNNGLNIEIETNGSIDISEFKKIINDRVSFTMDYKLPCSDMEDKMNMDNFKNLSKKDVIKFVVGTESELFLIKDLNNKYDLTENCNVYLSPVFGTIAPEKVVNFMKENKLNGIRLQIQLHKIIWKPEERGV